MEREQAEIGSEALLEFDWSNSPGQTIEELIGLIDPRIGHRPIEGSQACYLLGRPGIIRVLFTPDPTKAVLPSLSFWG